MRQRQQFGFALDRNRFLPPASINSRSTMCDAMPIIEIMRCHRDDRYRIVRNGYAGMQGKEAIDAVEAVMNRLLFSADARSSERAYDRVREEIKRMLSQAYSCHVDLSQLAADKAWPIFWASMVWRAPHPRQMEEFSRLRYRRENAGEKIAEFCEMLGMSKKDWKWFCNKDHFYLYRYFRSSWLRNIRLPEGFLEPIESSLFGHGPEDAWGNMPEHEGLHEWLRTMFLQENFVPDRRTLFYVLRDADDALRVGADITPALRATTIDQFRNALHSAEVQHTRNMTATEVLRRQRGMPPYGRSPPAHMMEDMQRLQAHLLDEISTNLSTSTANHLAAEGNRGGGLSIDLIRRAMEILDRTHVPIAHQARADYERMMQDMMTFGEGRMWIDEASQVDMSAVRMFPMRLDMIYGRAGGASIAGGGGGGGGFSTGIIHTKPETAEPFAWMEPYVKTHHLNSHLTGAPSDFTATLLADTMMVWDEAAKMEHCLYRNYTTRMKEGIYCAYHIDAPHLAKHGFTVGFTLGYKARATWTTPPKNPTTMDDRTWHVDQVRGKKNAIISNTDLDAFVTAIELQLNKRKPE